MSGQVVVTTAGTIELLEVAGPQGPPGPPGPPGPAGPPGTGSGSGDKNFRYDQTTAAATWVVPHGLGKYPSVLVFDSAGDQCDGHIGYPDANTVLLSFGAAFAGTAHLN